MKALTIISAVVLFVGCNSNVSFSEQCDARLGYGLNGPVKSVDYEEVYSEGNYLPIDRYAISTRPYAKCEFNKSGNIVKKHESGGKSDYTITDKIKYNRDGRVTHREILEGKHVNSIDIDYESVSDTLIFATYKSKDISTKIKVRYDQNGNFISYETENGYIIHNDHFYNPWLFRLAKSGEYLSELGHCALFVNRSSDNEYVTTRYYWFDSGKSAISLEFLDEYDAYSQLSKAFVVGGSVGYEWVDAGIMDVREGRVKYNDGTPITIAEYHHDNLHSGLETECIFTDKCDRGTYHITYAHEYDKYGNWVSRLRYIDGKLDRIEKRTIKYYGGMASKSSYEYIAQAQNAVFTERVREAEQRLEILHNPIVLQPYVCEFYDNMDDHFHIGVQDIVGFRFKADAINRSDRTFIGVQSANKYTTGKVDIWGDPITESVNKSYLALSFNKDIIMRDSYYSNPVNVSFEYAWKPQQTKTLEFDISPFSWSSADDRITIGYAQFMPKRAILHIEFELEDIDGVKTPIIFEYDLIDIWKDFANSLNNK